MPVYLVNPLLKRVISKLGIEVFNIASRAIVFSGRGAEVVLPLGGWGVSY